jgi:hypothetical protein
LLWVGPPPVPDEAPPRWPVADPAFVTAGMMAALRPLAGRVVMLRPGHAARLPGAQAQLHRRMADALAPMLQPPQA